MKFNEGSVDTFKAVDDPMMRMMMNNMNAQMKSTEMMANGFTGLAAAQSTAAAKANPQQAPPVSLVAAKRKAPDPVCSKDQLKVFRK